MQSFHVHSYYGENGNQNKSRRISIRALQGPKEKQPNKKTGTNHSRKK